MDKTYAPENIEQRLYQKWEAAGYFRPSGTGDPYCIMIPPPNVTGSLHMGHAFQHTLMDTLTRYKRMAGHNTLWQVGSDHAGIATQMVVERKLAAEGGPDRHSLGREGFINKVWEWKAESGGTITRQMRRLGDSVDWERERFTMDDGLSEAVQEVFVRLYNDGLIYRGKRLVNWDPALKTAISDLEVENKDTRGKIWQLRYPLANGQQTLDGQDHLVVATTRPETMLGDVCVAVHPDDERYQHLHGAEVILPLTGRRIPVVADSYVDQEFGTGCVKITPAHDFNDYEIGQRHELPLINILSDDARILATADTFAASGEVISQADLCATLPAEFAGLDRFVARDKLVSKLAEQGLLAGVEEHDNKVPYGDRSGEVIEPFLTDQWYVRVAPLAETATQAVADGDIEFVPKQYENMYFSWMRELQDWCISRQLWWGHRIPAWYDDAGQVYVGRSEAEVRQQYKLDNRPLHQDEDVLDTWFSSALWTFSTLGWPADTEALKTFHPTDVLVTGFDIIFFWVARMIMMTMHFIKHPDGTPQVPFRKVYVTGLIRDENGDKMSKSKGNVLDPLDMIDGISLDDLLAKRTANMMQAQKAAEIKQRTAAEFPQGIQAHGTDALRFTLAALASTGRDINWDMQRLTGYRNFCNKLWNASRFVLMNTEDQDCGQHGGDIELSLADQWVIEQFNTTVADFRQALDNYRFDQAANIAYEFTWNQFCDWYLELTKPILQNGTAAQQRGTRQTLIRTLEQLLRLMHPIIPFITEEIWQKVAPLAGAAGETIMLQPYPVAVAEQYPAARADLEWLKDVIVGIRTIRGEMDVSPNQSLDVLVKNADQTAQRRLTENSYFLSALANLNDIRFLTQTEEPPASATSLVGRVELHIPMAGLIDQEAELQRLAKAIKKAEGDLQRVTGKLSNDNFINKAPAEVIAKEQGKQAELQERLEQLVQQQEKISQL